MRRIMRWIAHPAFDNLPSALRQYPRWHFLGTWGFIGFGGDLALFQVEFGNVHITWWKRGEGP